MEKPTKILTAGIAIAGIVLAAGTYEKSHLDGTLATLGAQCEAIAGPIRDRGKADLAKTDCKDDMQCALEQPEAYGNSSASCTPKDLPYFSGSDQRLVALSVEAKTGVDSANWATEGWGLFLAVIIAVVCAIPWSWYFLLRRLSELRVAISGPGRR